ncbi:MAG TPA: hypothetical protein VG847_12355 [Chitinophagaceae bacterium]|nr:hypothetical protein [Chitinophagaceae bacterium]
MRKIAQAFTLILAVSACNNPANNNAAKTQTTGIEGTWKLLTGTLIEKNDTTVTDYTKGKEFIKIINDTHFAFLEHNTPKDSAAEFSAGGGPYDLHDSTYTEHLEYCNDRQWEGHDFSFTIAIHNDTLTQTGIEKIDSLNVNRLNIERYVRVQGK